MSVHLSTLYLHLLFPWFRQPLRLFPWGKSIFGPKRAADSARQSITSGDSPAASTVQQVMTSKKSPNFKHLKAIYKESHKDISFATFQHLFFYGAQQLTMYSCNIIFAEHRWIRLWQGFFSSNLWRNNPNDPTEPGLTTQATWDHDWNLTFTTSESWCGLPILRMIVNDYAMCWTTAKCYSDPEVIKGISLSVFFRGFF